MFFRCCRGPPLLRGSGIDALLTDVESGTLQASSAVGERAACQCQWSPKGLGPEPHQPLSKWELNLDNFLNLQSNVPICTL